MLHAEDPKIEKLLLEGEFGLEKESLRIDGNGNMAHTPHPFSQDDPHITRDFCENQVEVNTPVCVSAEDAVRKLDQLSTVVRAKLYDLPEREYLWPFSNPPYIRNENDIPVAEFAGQKSGKTVYRQYLSEKYGKYLMTYSGIHVNYSFSEELLRADFEKYCAEQKHRGNTLTDEGQEHSGNTQADAEQAAGSRNTESDGNRSAFQAYKDALYVHLAEQLLAYGWIMTCVTAASPLMDSSFIERGVCGEDFFAGMGSMRCSELGYWNQFTPVLDYTDIRSYAESMQAYVDKGLLRSPTELYYPIRLKPRGLNNLDTLKNEGVNHIELRMVDLNPLIGTGVAVRDVRFAQLLIVYLASTPGVHLDEAGQVQAVKNFKMAARYDLSASRIINADGLSMNIRDAALDILSKMRFFYRHFGQDVQCVLDFEESKFRNPEKLYSHIVRKKYSGGFVKKGLQHVKEETENFHSRGSYQNNGFLPEDEICAKYSG